MPIGTPSNDDFNAEAIFRELLAVACGEDLDAPPPSHDEVVEQALRDIAEERARQRAWRAANRPRLVADANASPEQAALLAARAEVAGRRRDALARLT